MKPEYKSYCGTCGHHMYYIPDKCPACQSSYVKKLQKKKTQLQSTYQRYVPVL